MADEDDGATPSELLLEACRRNNPSLLHTVLAQFPSAPAPSSTTKHPTTTTTTTNPPITSTSTSTSTSHPTTPLPTLLNTTLDPLGRTPLHICAAGGADEVLDLLLDQEGVEVEPRERHGGDTPLHCAVRYVMDAWGGYVRDRAGANRSSHTLAEEEGEVMRNLMVGVELLLDAGADPRVRNEDGRGVKPVGLLVGGDKKGWGVLREVLVKSEDELNVREVLEREVGVVGQGDEGPTGSQSDSD